MQVRIINEWTTGRSSVYVYDKQGTRFFAAKPSPLVMEEVPGYLPGESVADKIKPWVEIGLEFGPDFFSALAAELARLGYRNDEGEKQLADVLKAKDAHLEDMRRLVFMGDK